MLATNLEKEQAVIHRSITFVEGQKVSETRWNPTIRKTVETLRQFLRPGEEVFIELAPHNLAIIRRGVFYSITNGEKIIVDRCESIEVLDNGWIVACKHGCYNLYYKDGSQYKGLLFLKKSNAIKFAKTL